jgi:ribosome-associated translation inhibitor RaiA
MPLIPTQVTFRGLAHSDALEADIREKTARLENFYSGIVGCQVLVELPHRHRRDGRHFHIRIEVTVPRGRPIVVTHEPSAHGPLKDVEAPAHRKQTEAAAVHRYARVAVREAFEAARRQLQDFAREQRGHVKTHRAAQSR